MKLNQKDWEKTTTNDKLELNNKLELDKNIGELKKKVEDLRALGKKSFEL